MRHILLIDDDERLSAPLAEYLLRFDLRLDSAVRPGLGLARLREGGYDAVILDVMLPEMDGFEVCRTIRKESDVPILMLTARGDVMDRVVGLEVLPDFGDFAMHGRRHRAHLQRRVEGHAHDARMRSVEFQAGITGVSINSGGIRHINSSVVGWKSAWARASGRHCPDCSRSTLEREWIDGVAPEIPLRCLMLTSARTEITPITLRD